MKSSRNIRLAAAGALVVALAAAGAAFGASRLHGGTHTGSAGPPGTFVDSGTGSPHRPWRGPGGPRPGDGLAAAATYLGISQSALQTQLRSGKTLAQIADATSGKSASGLVDALVADAKTHIAQAVADGRLTQAQADRIEQDLEQRIANRVNHSGPAGPGPGRGSGDELAAAATYLGVSQTDLIAQLRAGKTLGQIADATSGKSRGGLVAALVAHEKSELAQAVTDGRLTQDRADRLAANLDERIAHLVDEAPPPHPDGPPPGAPPA